MKENPTDRALNTSALADAWKLIAYWLGEGARPSRGVPPLLLGRIAERHRFDAALAAPQLTAVSPQGDLDAATWDRFQAAHAAALACSVWRAAPARAVLDALAPLPVIVLKGAAYAELLYPTPGARSHGDLDILVPAQSLSEALSACERLGFEKEHPGHPILDAAGYHERQLHRADLDLDLHQAFTQPARLPIDYGEVFARSLSWAALAPNARLLAPEDALVYHAIHAGCGELAPDTAPAIELLDLKLMLSRRDAFWGSAGGPALDLALAADRACEWGAERMLYATLAAAARLFPSLEPARARLARPLTAPTRLLLDEIVVSRSSPPRLRQPARPEILLRKALLLRPGASWGLLALRLRQLRRARGRPRAP
ncbi:MAG: nucleotidyltransferase family protein [Myxococcales bacterium]